MTSTRGPLKNLAGAEKREQVAYMSQRAISKDPLILGRSRVTGRLVLRPAVPLKRIILSEVEASAATAVDLPNKATAKKAATKKAETKNVVPKKMAAKKVVAKKRKF